MRALSDVSALSCVGLNSVVQLKYSEARTEGTDQLPALGLHRVWVVLVPAGICSQIYE